MELTVIGMIKTTTVAAITMAARGVQKTNQQCAPRKLVLVDPITAAHQTSTSAKKISEVRGYVVVVWITVCYINIASF